MSAEIMDGVITDALMGSGHGTLYRLIREHQPTQRSTPELR